MLVHTYGVIWCGPVQTMMDGDGRRWVTVHHRSGRSNQRLCICLHQNVYTFLFLGFSSQYLCFELMLEQYAHAHVCKCMGELRMNYNLSD